jgi:large subunit ribosomal protein L4
VNEPVLHQTVKAYLNNQRQGTSATKTRSFVSGGNQKPWKQKGTGRARAGSIRAPHWRGGGIVFGPQPRDYHTEVPRKVKQLARKSAFNARAREGRLHVVEKVTFEAPKTKQLTALLGNLGLEGMKVLVLTNGANRNAWLSSRNLPTVHVMPYAEVSAYDVIWSDALVVEEGTRLGRQVARGDRAAPDDDVAAARYEAADETLSAAGLQWYEISNWAKPGRECRHNLNYWRFGDYLGIGAGAHGKRSRIDPADGSLRKRIAPDTTLLHAATARMAHFYRLPFQGGTGIDATSR